MCQTLHCESDIYTQTHQGGFKLNEAELREDKTSSPTTTHFPWCKIRGKTLILELLLLQSSFLSQRSWHDPVFLGVKDRESWRGWARKRRGGGRRVCVCVWGGVA